MAVLSVCEGTHHVSSGLAVGTGNAVIHASGRATVVLFDHAVCEAEGDAHCTAKDNSRVVLRGRSEAVMHDQSNLYAFDESTFTALDQSSATASDTASGFLGHRASFHGRLNAHALSMSSGHYNLADNASLEIVRDGKLVTERAL